MSGKRIENILKQFQEGTLPLSEAVSQLQTFQDLGFAKLDTNREERTGFPEVVFGEGKTTEQLIQIITSLKEKVPRILVTRVESEKAAELVRLFPDLEYNELARTLAFISPAVKKVVYEGYIAVVCAGTSDLPAAEEAVVTAETFGCKVERYYDVGVAGIHRLFNQLDAIKGASASVVVAGMEGALASVLGGLVDHPVIAVPTSIGYGANFQGLSALLSMLNACAPGISVVNIDNGFGGGYNAALISRNQYRGKGM